jgi:hypothetical protein
MHILKADFALAGGRHGACTRKIDIHYKLGSMSEPAPSTYL